MEITSSQQSKAKVFNDLHYTGEILVLPNIWDPLGAALLEGLDYRAVATASASVAFTNGYDDGEFIPFQDVLVQLKKIVSKVNLPVTADIESGYANTETELRKNVEQLVSTGIVGINFEDYDKLSDCLYPIDVQCKRIDVVRKVSEDMGISLFINARTDVYLRGKTFVTEDEKFLETLKRARAYLDAGANCLFPPAMKDKDDLEKLITSLRCPVNVMAVPGIPDLKTLQEIGVARLSLGPGFLKIAIKAMKELAVKLKKFDGLDEVLRNDVTSAELKNLILRERS